jgi:hypothetical protein
MIILIVLFLAFLRIATFFELSRVCIIVILGSQRRGQKTQPPESKRELLEWVLQNWGNYDHGVIGAKNATLPLENCLDGGLGRGKISLGEKVSSLISMHVRETKNGLIWIE